MRLENMISSRVRFVVQLDIRGFKQSPYFQGYFESDNAATIEFSSERYVSPGFTTEQKESLKILGWVLHTNPDMPNYIKFLTSVESETSAIAGEFVKVLAEGLKLSPQDVGIDWIQAEETRIGV